MWSNIRDGATAKPATSGEAKDNHGDHLNDLLQMSTSEDAEINFDGPSILDDEEEDSDPEYVPESLLNFVQNAKNTLRATQESFLSSMADRPVVEADVMDEHVEEARLRAEMHRQRLLMSPELLKSPPPNPTSTMTDSAVKRSAMENPLMTPPPPSKPAPMAPIVVNDDWPVASPPSRRGSDSNDPIEILDVTSRDDMSPRHQEEEPVLLMTMGGVPPLTPKNKPAAAPPVGDLLGDAKPTEAEATTAVDVLGDSEPPTVESEPAVEPEVDLLGESQPPVTASEPAMEPAADLLGEDPSPPEPTAPKAVEMAAPPQPQRRPPPTPEQTERLSPTPSMKESASVSSAPSLPPPGLEKPSEPVPVSESVVDEEPDPMVADDPDPVVDDEPEPMFEEEPEPEAEPEIVVEATVPKSEHEVAPPVTEMEVDKPEPDLEETEPKSGSDENVVLAEAQQPASPLQLPSPDETKQSTKDLAPNSRPAVESQTPEAVAPLETQKSPVPVQAAPSAPAPNLVMASATPKRSEQPAPVVQTPKSPDLGQVDEAEASSKKETSSPPKEQPKKKQSPSAAKKKTQVAPLPAKPSRNAPPPQPTSPPQQQKRTGFFGSFTERLARPSAVVEEARKAAMAVMEKAAPTPETPSPPKPQQSVPPPKEEPKASTPEGAPVKQDSSPSAGPSKPQASTTVIDDVISPLTDPSSLSSSPSGLPAPPSFNKEAPVAVESLATISPAAPVEKAVSPSADATKATTEPKVGVSLVGANSIVPGMQVAVEKTLVDEPRTPLKAADDTADADAESVVNRARKLLDSAKKPVVTSRLAKPTAASSARRERSQKVVDVVGRKSVGSPKSDSMEGVSGRLMKPTACSEAHHQHEMEPKVEKKPKIPKPLGGSSRLMQPTAASRAKSPPKSKVAVSVEEARAKARERVRERMMKQQQQQAAVAEAEQKETRPANTRVKLSAEEGIARARERVRQRQLERAASEKRVGVEKENARRSNTNSRTTQPFSPTFATTARYGKSKVGDRKDEPTLAQSGDNFSRHLRDDRSLVSNASSRGSKPRLTIPQAPKLASTKRLGESKPHEAKKEFTLAQSTDLLRRGLRDDASVMSNDTGGGSRKKRPTIPHAPRLSTSTRLGEKIPAAQGPRAEITLAQSTAVLQSGLRVSDPSLMEKREKRLTEPHAPRFHRSAPRERPKSTEEKEAELMDYFHAHPFKAKPVRNVQSTLSYATTRRTDRRMTLPAPTTAKAGVPGATPATAMKPAPREPLTEPQRGKYNAKSIRARQLQVEPDVEDVRSFKARSVPKTTYSATPVAPRTPSTAASVRSRSSSTASKVHSLATSQRKERREAIAEASHKKAEALLKERETRSISRQREQLKEALREQAEKAKKSPKAEEIRPFSLQSSLRHEAYKKKVEEQRHEEEERRKEEMSFHARPFKATAAPAPVKSPKGPSSAQPFHLESLSRHQQHLEEEKRRLAEEEAERRRQATFKAKPLPKSTYSFKPVSPRQHPPVDPRSPQLASTSRAEDRKAFDAYAESERLAAEARRQETKARLEAEEAEDLRQRRNLPASEGGMIPTALPIIESNPGSPSSRYPSR